MPGARQSTSGAQAEGTACSTPGDSCSTNWSGLEVWNGTFTGVSADWTIPTVTPTGTALEDSSTWIGLNGDPTFDDSYEPSPIQVGTDSPSESGSIVYEAWYELLPGLEIPLFEVSPGDAIQAVINETSPGNWQMAIGDLTSGIAWSASDITYDSPGLTAEWIEEATDLCTGSADSDCAMSQLQNFGSVKFTQIAYAHTGTDNAHD